MCEKSIHLSPWKNIALMFNACSKRSAFVEVRGMEVYTRVYMFFSTGQSSRDLRAHSVYSKENNKSSSQCHSPNHIYQDVSLTEHIGILSQGSIFRTYH